LIKPAKKKQGYAECPFFCAMNVSLWGLLLANALLPIALNSSAQASETSDQFEAALAKACEAQETPEMCSCYAKEVTSQYNDNQLVSFFNLLKDREANDMFLVIQSQVGMNCKNTTVEN
jgi:hypothetical protein